MSVNLSVEKLPRNNLGLHRLQNFVGRIEELNILKARLEHYPLIAITGPPGAGKSSLATALAVSEAERFEEGILWISASGNRPFDFYDIVRDVEDVLATGITNQPPRLWPLLVLQQLYGFSRLLILDELADADEETVEQIISMIGQIGPGGRGRFVLIGRTLPQPLLDLVGVAHLKLSGLDELQARAWINRARDRYHVSPRDLPLLYKLTWGHPLAMNMAANLWSHTDDRLHMIDLVAAQSAIDWEARLGAIITASLHALERNYPDIDQFLLRCSRASGGFSSEAIAGLFWQEGGDTRHRDTAVGRLVEQGLLMFDDQTQRYYVHPLIRRYLNTVDAISTSATQRWQDALAHARYYLLVARRYHRTPPHRWADIDYKWGNVRDGFVFLTKSLESAIGMSVEQGLLVINTGTFPALPPNIDPVMVLLRDYGMALSRYVLWRHPPESRRWISASILACRHLNDRRAEAMLAEALAGLDYFHRDYAAARMWYRRALPFFQETNDHLRTMRVLKNLGTAQRAMDNMEEALNHYTEAISLAETHGIYAEQMALCTLMASAYFRRHEYDRAVACYKDSLALAKTHNDSSWQAVQYNNLGLVVEADDKCARAVGYYKRAAALHEACGDKKGLCTVYSNLGAAYFKLDRPQMALDWYQQAMKLRGELGDWLDVAAILHNMGYIATEMRDTPTAIDYYARSRDLYQQFGQTELAEEEQFLIDDLRQKRASAA